MKLLLTVVVLSMMTSVTWAADVTSADVTTITDANSRSLSAREVVSEFRGHVAVTDSYVVETNARLTRLLGFKEAMGTGDIIVPKGFIDGIIDAYTDVQGVNNQLKNTNTQLKAKFPCLLRGECGEEK